MNQYFISYAYYEKPKIPLLKQGHGFGSIAVELSHPIARFDDVLLVAERIREAMLKQTGYEDIDISVINWKPFEPDVERLPHQDAPPNNVISIAPRRQ